MQPDKCRVSFARAILVLLLVDGLADALVGHRLVSAKEEVLPRPARPVVQYFRRIPEPLFRAASLAQAGVALIVLRRTHDLQATQKPKDI